MAKAGSKAVDGSTEQQKLFAYAYFNNGGHGTNAAIEAGYSERSATVTASRLLTYANIQAILANLHESLKERAIVTKEQIAKEWAKIGFSDIRQLFNDDNQLLDIKQIPDEIAASLSSVEIEELLGDRETVFTKREQIGWTKKLKLWSKPTALTALAELYGYNAPTKVAQTDKDGEDVAPSLSDTQFAILIKKINEAPHPG